MRNGSSHKSTWFRLGALLTVIAMAMLWVSSPYSLAQQENRQLKREQTQPNGASVRRIALVIGNGAYISAPPLKNPPNDARDMAATLKTLGFAGVSGINVNQRDMKRLIREFGQKLKAGGSGLFYYAGHGVQSKGRNYLIPVDAEITSETDVEDQAVDLNLVLGLMDEAGNGLNIVILDACRNNPFSRSFRSAGSGLAQVDAPTGTLIAYATSPGRVASDGQGRNGLYTSELLQQMRVPGIGVEEMFKAVRVGVKTATKNQQTPWESSSLVGEFCFAGGCGNASTKTSNAPANTMTGISELAKEEALWEAVKDSNDPQDFTDYLAKYPNGAYVSAARVRLRHLAVTNNSNMTSSSNTANSNSGATKNDASLATLPRTRMNQTGIDFVYVPPGEFMMGSINGNPAEKPVHRVTINNGFYMGKYEVTQAQWQVVMGNRPSQFNGDSLPVDNVSWNDIQRFIRKLNQMNDGYIYRLPTEAEWEYACRAGSTNDNTDHLGGIAWYSVNSDYATHPAGTKQANGFGLYDMQGNVQEWCEDWYHPSYEGAPDDGSAWLSGGEQTHRVLRGGALNDVATSLRSASRSGLTPGSRDFDSGFRLVAVPRTQ